MRPDVMDRLESIGMMDPDDNENVKKQSPFLEVLKRLAQNKIAVAGLIIVIVFALIAIFAPFLTTYDPVAINLKGKNLGPMVAGHICGTDSMGRDIFSRLIYGARYSLGLGFASVVVGLIAGIILGCVAGYFGGVVEELIMRACDVFQAIPGTLLAIVISAALGSGFTNTIIALSISRVPFTCRMIRAQFLNQRKLEYVEAAQAENCSKLALMFKHILPNTISPIIVATTMGIGGTIMMAASLSYIGLGIQPPTPEWGAMLSDAKAIIRFYPYQALAPGLCIAIIVLALNLFGDGLRDAMDPKLKN